MYDYRNDAVEEAEEAEETEETEETEVTECPAVIHTIVPGLSYNTVMNIADFYMLKTLGTDSTATYSCADKNGRLVLINTKAIASIELTISDFKNDKD